MRMDWCVNVRCVVEILSDAAEVGGLWVDSNRMMVYVMLKVIQWIDEKYL